MTKPVSVAGTCYEADKPFSGQGRRQVALTGPATSIEFVKPSLDRLPSYMAALEVGWSPTTTRDASREQLGAVRADAGTFLRGLTQREGGTVTLADGTSVLRLHSD